MKTIKAITSVTIKVVCGVVTGLSLFATVTVATSLWGASGGWPCLFGTVAAMGFMAFYAIALEAIAFMGEDE